MAFQRSYLPADYPTHKITASAMQMKGNVHKYAEVTPSFGKEGRAAAISVKVTGCRFSYKKDPPIPGPETNNIVQSVPYDKDSKIFKDLKATEPLKPSIIAPLDMRNPEHKQFVEILKLYDNAVLDSLKENTQILNKGGLQTKSKEVILEDSDNMSRHFSYNPEKDSYVVFVGLATPGFLTGGKRIEATKIQVLNKGRVSPPIKWGILYNTKFTLRLEITPSPAKVVGTKLFCMLRCFNAVLLDVPVDTSSVEITSIPGINEDIQETSEEKMKELENLSPATDPKENALKNIEAYLEEPQIYDVEATEDLDKRLKDYNGGLSGSL